MVGERILSRFTLEERLGSGGFGTVYRAWDERLHRPVAVKVIESGRHVTERVVREAQAAARLAHTGIVTLYELAHDDHHAFLVTELVEGATLRDLTVRGEISDREIAEIGADACDALAHAHAHDVVHRDIKPHNILVAEKSGEAKLVDFGIARLLDEATLTASGDLLGTIAYMAPEQAEGERPGPEADTYSLALTLYEAWAGEHPLLRRSAAATARAIGDPVPRLRRSRPDLPERLTEMIDACLHLLPEQRPSVAELGTVLGRAAPALGDTALPALDPEREEPRQLPRLPAVPLMPAALVALCIFAIAIADVPLDPWVLAIPAVCTPLALARPRLALGIAAAGLAVWIGTAAHDYAPSAALAALATAMLARSGADVYAGREEPTLP